MCSNFQGCIYISIGIDIKYLLSWLYFVYEFFTFQFSALWDVIHGGGPEYLSENISILSTSTQHFLWLCIWEICCQKQMILRQTKCMTRNLKLASSNIHCLTEVHFYSSDDRKKAFCLKLNHFQEKSVINIAKVKSNIAFKGCLKKGSFTEMSVCR